MKTALVWRESVYKNNFRCSHCGAQLWDAANDQPTANLGYDPDIPNNLHCMKCKTCVATMKEYDGVGTGMAGRWEDAQK